MRSLLSFHVSPSHSSPYYYPPVTILRLNSHPIAPPCLRAPPFLSPFFTFFLLHDFPHIPKKSDMPPSRPPAHARDLTKPFTVPSTPTPARTSSCQPQTQPPHAHTHTVPTPDSPSLHSCLHTVLHATQARARHCSGGDGSGSASSAPAYGPALPSAPSYTVLLHSPPSSPGPCSQACCVGTCHP